MARGNPCLPQTLAKTCAVPGPRKWASHHPCEISVGSSTKSPSQVTS